MDLNIKDKDTFTDDLLGMYLLRGFGALSKREMDVLMMHLMIKHSDLGKFSNHDISIKFKITESKVKNLRYAGKLMFIENSEEYIKNEFYELLKKADFHSEEKIITLVVEDTYLRNGIQAKLKSIDKYADTSFNRELLKISENSFYELLESFFSVEERKQFEDELNDAIKQEKKISLKEALKDIFKNELQEELTKQGKKVINLGIVAMIKHGPEIANFISDAIKFYR